MSKTFDEISKEIDVTRDGRTEAMNAIDFIGDIYIFGVWSGMSMNFEVEYLADNHIRYHKMFGFDSFIGFPEEKGRKYFIPYMEKGGYSSAKLYETTPKKVAKIIAKGIGSDKLKLVLGYFSDSLTLKLIEKEKMIPASFIDIDADLYSSTFEALKFMFSNNLVIPGTIIYFDDWGATGEYEGGESLAWLKATAIYNIKYNQIFSTGRRPNVMKVFKIIS